MVISFVFLVLFLFPIISSKLYVDLQVQLLMVVHHRNLVSLIGYCEESEYMALIYEFMSNGNVRQHLSGLYCI